MRSQAVRSVKDKYFITSGWTEEFLKEDRSKKMNEELTPILSAKKKLKVLDIGSGDGAFISFLQSQFPRHSYYACDISPEVIKNRKDKPAIKWEKVDFNRPVPYPKDFFDVIIAGEVVEHLFNTDNFFKEVFSILKRDGVFLLTTPNLASWMGRLFLLFGFQPFSTEVSNESNMFGKEFIYNLMGREVSQSVGHLRVFTKKALRAILKYYNFKIYKEVACHIQPWHINRFFTKFLPELSEGQIVIATK